MNDYWCIPSKEDADFVACMEDADFVACMEDVLDVTPYCN